MRNRISSFSSDICIWESRARAKKRRGGEREREKRLRTPWRPTVQNPARIGLLLASHAGHGACLGACLGALRHLVLSNMRGLRDFSVYETSQRVYVAANDRESGCWRLLKFERGSEPELAVSEDPAHLSAAELQGTLRRLHEGTSKL